MVTCQVIRKDEDAFLRTDSGEKKKNLSPPKSVLDLSSFSLSHEDRTYRFLHFSLKKKKKGLPLKILVIALRILLE